jgi:glycosyltransferase involved in cell wall biosynthesis
MGLMAKRIVSVVVPTRNRPDTLRAALASIRALEGDDLTFEILVGDNGAAPETKQVAAEFAAKYAQTGKNGCPSARNVAMRLGTGEFYAFLDDDDVWLAENIRPHIKLLDENPGLQAVFGQVVQTDAQLNPICPAYPDSAPANDDWFMRMMSGYFAQVGATVVRGDVVREIGLMDESLIGDSDWDWQLRIAGRGQIGFTPVPCVLCRGRPDGSYDDLQKRRAVFTRRIFWRHAMPNRGRWPSATALLRSYFGSIETYYTYFERASAMRAEAGQRWPAARAFWQSFLLCPHWAAKRIARGARRAAPAEHPTEYPSALG